MATTVTFVAPVGLAADSHQRDAHLWAWVESQNILTVENIEVVKGEVTISLAFEHGARDVARLLVAFADNFGE